MTALDTTDPTSLPPLRDTWINRQLTSLLYDPRDVVFLYLLLKVVLVMGTFFVLFFWRFSWLYVPAFVVAYALLATPVILMLHCTMHRPFLKRRPLLSRAVVYGTTFLFGIPAGYMEHHIGMHHPENNAGEDLSATLRYRRDSVLHFALYFTRFMLFTVFELTAYLRRKKRFQLARRAVTGEVVQLAVIGLGLWWNWRAALVCLAIPYALVRFAMMAGNWGQHAFIDPAAPTDSLRNSINCIETRYNRIAFNDGYHIVHHEKPSLHWTEMPAYFHQHRERYARAGAIVFRGLDFFVISLLLWTKRYDVLARHLVCLDGRDRSLADRVAFLKSRTQPILGAPEPLPAVSL